MVQGLFTIPLSGGGSVSKIRDGVGAVVRNLETIGEAVRHIPDSVRQHYPEIPWRWAQGFGFAFQNLCALNPHSIRLSSALPML